MPIFSYIWVSKACNTRSTILMIFNVITFKKLSHHFQDPFSNFPHQNRKSALFLSKSQMLDFPNKILVSICWGENLLACRGREKLTFLCWCSRKVKLSPAASQTKLSNQISYISFAFLIVSLHPSSSSKSLRFSMCAFCFYVYFLSTSCFSCLLIYS